MTRTFKILLALDQALGPWLFRDIYPDESISAYAHRTKKTRLEAVINFISSDPNHCADAYKSEKNGTQNAPEYRQQFDNESA